MTHHKTSQGMIWRGELAVALLSDDADAADLVARNLGLVSVAPRVAKPMQVVTPKDFVTPERVVTPRQIFIPKQNDEHTRSVNLAQYFDENIVCDYLDNLEASTFLQPFRYESRSDIALPVFQKPKWQWRTPPQNPPKYIPIASKRVVHPRLRTGMGSLSQGCGLDISRIIHSLVRAEPLYHLPRRRLHRWGRRILIVLDRSERLVPFFYDQELLCRQLESLTAVGTITQLFTNNPDDGFAFVDAHGNLDEWTFDKPARVIILGDLGVLQRGGSGYLQRRWCEWGRKLSDQGCSLTALVPFPANVGGSNLRRLFALVPWQRTAQHYVQDEVRRSQLVEELLTAASPVVRLEPGLLRLLRTTIPNACDASLESDTWQHAMVTSRHVDAATLDRATMEKRFCPAFSQLPRSVRSRFLTAIRAWRFNFRSSPEVWFQEILNLDADSQSIIEEKFPGDLQDAISGIHDLANRATLKGDSRSLLKLREYGGRAANWLSARAWQDPRIRQALHDLIAAAPDAVRREKGGLDPALIRPERDQPISVMLSQCGGDFQFSIQGSAITAMVSSFRTRNRWFEVASVESLPDRTNHNGAVSLRVDFVHAAQAPIPATSVVRVSSDIDSLEIRNITKPDWASAIGRDRYGLWAEFTLLGEDTHQRRASAESMHPVASVGVEARLRIVQRMRWIPPGRFLMGAPDDDDMAFDCELPQHEVTLSYGYWLFDTLVTQELWLAVMNTNPSVFQGARRPVEHVSWVDCHAFLDKINTTVSGLNLSLPSEAEWEYACRSGTTSRYSFGNESLIRIANFNYGDFAMSATSEVAGYPANAWGLFDMHGNVREWCEDYWTDRYAAGASIDPMGPSTGRERVLRGGSWESPAQFVRSTYRFPYNPVDQNGFVGFRCAQIHPSDRNRS